LAGFKRYPACAGSNIFEVFVALSYKDETSLIERSNFFLVPILFDRLASCVLSSHRLERSSRVVEGQNRRAVGNENVYNKGMAALLAGFLDSYPYSVEREFR